MGVSNYKRPRFSGGDSENNTSSFLGIFQEHKLNKMVQSPSSAKQKVSAFAVKQRGDTLDEKTKKQLAASVQKLHQDQKLEKTAQKIAESYEKNVRNRQAKKERKKKAKREALQQARQLHQDIEPVSERVPEPVEMPLSWYDAPDKKTRKRKKVTESTEPIPESISKPKQGKRKKSDKTDDSTKPVPAINTDDSLIPLPKVPKEVFRDNRRVEAKSNSKKIKQSDWKPPTKHQEIDSAPPMLINGSKKQKPQPPPVVQECESEEDDDLDDDLVEVSHENPDEVAKNLFAKLIHPHKPATFFQKYWLKRPLHIKRNKPDYFEEDNWFSTSELDRILAEERVRFGVNIDLTTYKDGKRETHNPAGRAYPSIVWDHYQQGCSVRLLNPQTYCEETWYLLSTLQELFGCMVGANVYLTPPGTQGFAPHFDDIEAFVLQLEGKKHWRVYGPRTDGDVWPLYSSPNMTQEELGKPLLDCVLEPGDLLYFPRGAIHQAMTQNDQHSLHITVSTHQKNSWSDLLQLMLPAALANATENDPEFRESLPNDYLNYTGIAFQEQACIFLRMLNFYVGVGFLQDCPARRSFMEKVRKLMDKLTTFSPVDGACDLMAKKFIHDSLPPYLNPTERGYSVAEQGEKWMEGEVKESVEVQPDTKIRLIRKHSLRIVNEPAESGDAETEKSPSDPAGSTLPDESFDWFAIDKYDSCVKEDNSEAHNICGDNEIRIYYNTDNDRLYHSNALQYFPVDADLAPAVEFLQTSYPEFTAVEDLPLQDVTEKMDVAMQLYDRGLLITEELLEWNDMLEEEGEDDSEGGDSEDDDSEGGSDNADTL